MCDLPSVQAGAVEVGVTTTVRSEEYELPLTAVRLMLAPVRVPDSDGITTDPPPVNDRFVNVIVTSAAATGAIMAAARAIQPERIFFMVRNRKRHRIGTGTVRMRVAGGCKPWRDLRFDDGLFVSAV